MMIMISSSKTQKDIHKVLEDETPQIEDKLQQQPYLSLTDGDEIHQRLQGKISDIYRLCKKYVRKTNMLDFAVHAKSFHV